jgi:dCMP deaminase
MDISDIGIDISIDPRYKEWLKECYAFAAQSKHPTTHNAAFIIDGDAIVVRGKNDLPPGVKASSERLDGENRHIYLNHAERDAVYRAAREGIKTDGLTMVMPWLPCVNCANAVISSGIKRLIVHKQMAERTREKWQQELRAAVTIMQETGILVIAYDGSVGAKAYQSGEHWDA